jgi:hypothetical protein
MAASSVLCLFSASSGGLAVYKFALQNINNMGEM